MDKLIGDKLEVTVYISDTLFNYIESKKDGRVSNGNTYIKCDSNAEDEGFLYGGLIFIRPGIITIKREEFFKYMAGRNNIVELYKDIAKEYRLTIKPGIDTHDFNMF